MPAGGALFTDADVVVLLPLVAVSLMANLQKNFYWTPRVM
jgi:hypothetical protein